jgi:hypothetical protein
MATLSTAVAAALDIQKMNAKEFATQLPARIRAYWECSTRGTRGGGQGHRQPLTTHDGARL